MKINLIYILALTLLFMANSCKKEESQLSKDCKAIETYLNENGITAQTSQNVYYVVISEGTGAQCNAGDLVACKYKLSSINNPEKIIDQTDKHAYECQLPDNVPTFNADVIPGFQIALLTLKEGGKSTFYVPSSLAYGSNIIGDDSYNNLIFEIELCEIISNGTKH